MQHFWWCIVFLVSSLNWRPFSSLLRQLCLLFSENACRHLLCRYCLSEVLIRLPSSINKLWSSKASRRLCRLCKLPNSVVTILFSCQRDLWHHANCKEFWGFVRVFSSIIYYWFKCGCWIFNTLKIDLVKSTCEVLLVCSPLLNL